MKKIMWFVILGCLLLSPMAVTAQTDSQQSESDYYFDSVCNLTNLTGANIAAEGPFAKSDYTSPSYKTGTLGKPVKVRVYPNDTENKPVLDMPAKERIKLDKTKTCACGDICVNTTGWWRDGGIFYLSDTPIQAAIDNATAGETICVKDGIYNENVDVDKSLTIRSENGAASTTVNAFDYNYHVFVVTADYVNILGFTVKGALEDLQAGIYLGDTHHCIISDNTASSNDFGIGLEYSGNNELKNNSASNNNCCGIWVRSSGGNTITNNTASGNYYVGICLLHGSCDNNIHSNIVSNNGYNNVGDYAGIYLYSSSSNNIYNNYFNNTNNAYDDGNNTWNTTKKYGKNIIGGSWLGGNYWSDYTGEDTTGDGLGDTLLPYNSNGTITTGGDWLPLVQTTPCFIATAAYGTPLHDDINVLREFRDGYMMTNPVGQAMVKIYYATSPPIADLIRANEGLRATVRAGFVKPLVDVTRLFVD